MSISPAKLIASVTFVLVCSLTPEGASGFWLTDGSLFQAAQAPADVAPRQLEVIAATPVLSPQIGATVAAAASQAQSDLLANAMVATNRLEAATKIGPPQQTTGAATGSQQAAQPSSSSSSQVSSSLFLEAMLWLA